MINDDPLSLSNQITTVHEETKPLKSSQYPDLKRHVASVHDRKKPFKCSQCDSSFSSKQHMNRHITSVREGKKQLTFKYSECDSSFSKKGEMKKCFLSS